MKKIIPLLVVLSVMLVACAAKKATKPDNVQFSKEQRLVKNVEAFAKLYGYVRYFHPSNEAIELDWNKFLVYGISKVKAAKSNEGAKQILNELFDPITTNLLIYQQNTNPASPSLEPSNGRMLRTWQHIGLGGQGSSFYTSSFTGTFEPLSSGDGFIYRLDDKDYKDKYLKISAKVKADFKQPYSGAALFMSSRNYKGKNFYSSDFQENLITENVWKTHELIAKFEHKSQFFWFGGNVSGKGQAWFKDVELFVSEDKKTWKEIEFPNAKFTQVNSEVIPLKWRSVNSGLYEYQVLSDNTLKVKSIDSYIPGAIFKELPEPNSMIDEPIGLSLNVRLPLTLWAEKSNATSNERFAELQRALENINLNDVSAMDENIRLANIVIAWNTLQHFYPYFDVVDVDWEKELVTSLEDVLDERSKVDYFNTLEKMIAKIEDGHGVVRRKEKLKRGGLPLVLSWIENKVVVVGTNSPVFKYGDVIEYFDGKSAEELLLEIEQHVSGSPHLKRYRALNLFGRGELGSVADIQLSRNGERFSIEFILEEDKRSIFFSNFKTYLDLPDIKEIEEGIYYVNYTTARQEHYQKHFQQLAKAKGIIYDYRYDGRPVDWKKPRMNLRSDVVAHLIKEPKSTTTFKQPKYLYPNQKDVTFKESNWNISPIEPYFRGKKIFINTPANVSHGETIMGFIDHYNLGDTLGDATAGANGNVNYIRLIGGDSIWFTGMKVQKHDGEQLHLIGYQPDYPVKNTIEAVRDGRDLYLEKALEVIKQ